jgi:hypothetical protein
MIKGKLPRRLSQVEIDRMSEIFLRKGWANGRLFDDFCERVSALKSEDEKQLFFELTERFIYVPLSCYSEHTAIAAQQIQNEIPLERKLVFLNGLTCKESHKVKSNYLVTYQFKASTLKKAVNWNGRKISVINSIKELFKMKTENVFLVLTDDFLGSGETMVDALKYIQHRLSVHGITMPKCGVLAIAAMESAISRLNGLSVKVFCSLRLKKGITDFYTGDKLKKSVSIMQGIESRMKVRDNTRFGYGASEALICMERCPNNTFPVFWMKKGAPYER